MRAYDIIKKKRDGGKLTDEEIRFFVNGYTSGEIADYQAAAFCMAIYFRGMDGEETSSLTFAFRDSGSRADFSEIKGLRADKHSTGGVGDGISLALAPLVACAGVAVPMMSGRGLGHTGGTLDKLESMKNFEVRVPVKSIHRQMQKLGVCMFGQTQDLAPADKKLYSLRDASSTVESRPLIVASILSKKYAEGVDSLLMDVKYGSGAFMKKLEDSRKLARALVATAKLLGLKCRALITYMDQPLGRAIGNGNEMLQTVRILKGEKDLAPDFYELLLEQAANMLVISGKQKDIKKARKILEEKIANGEALAKLRELVKWQGGDTQAVDNPEKYFKPAKLTVDFKAPQAGYVAHIDALLTGQASVLLGAGRNRMEDAIDYGAGLWLHKKCGDAVKKGDVVATLYASDKKRLEDGLALFAKAVKFTKTKPKAYKIIKEVIK